MKVILLTACGCTRQCNIEHSISDTVEIALQNNALVKYYTGEVIYPENICNIKTRTFRRSSYIRDGLRIYKEIVE